MSVPLLSKTAVFAGSVGGLRDHLEAYVECGYFSKPRQNCLTI
jgi:hypothetical protein